MVIFLFCFRMADSVIVCSDTTSVGEQSEHEPGAKSRGEKLVRTVSVKDKTKNARDLVRDQEKLLTVLHDLKYDLAKMDREANRIREDVIRSKQMFSVIFNKPEAHHMPLASDSFRPSHSSSPMVYRNKDNELSIHYLNKIPTVSQTSIHSRNRRETHSSGLDDIRQRVARFAHRVGGDSDRSSRCYTADEYSGTESDAESTTSSRYWTQDSMGSLIGSAAGSTYYGSSESLSEEAGSSTESNTTISSRSVSVHHDQSSYFYKQKRKL